MQWMILLSFFGLWTTTRGAKARSEETETADPDDLTPPVSAEPRPADGLGTNALNPEWGATGQELIRLGEANYTDGIGAVDPDAPNAREVSNAIAQQTAETPSSEGISNLFWAWGQFIDHDLSLTPSGHTEFSPVIAPMDDPVFDPGTMIPFTRVDPVEGSGETGPRAFANEITAFMDGSMIYGSDAETAAALRDGANLRVAEDDNLILTDHGMLAGDVRAAENVALTSMHTIFTREHNRLVEEFRETRPDLDEDGLFDHARAHVEAKLQAITYNEWLPILTGEGALEAYAGYDETVNPGISVEFSTAAFRFGHSLLPTGLDRTEEDGSEISAGALSLQAAFFNPTAILTGGGVDPILRGLAGSDAQELDTQIVEDVRSFLVGETGETGLDLAALNIARGRDLGVGSYNDLRETLGLDRVEGFDEITSDADLAATLEQIYGDVDAVDAWIGGLAEDAVPGGLVGETFALVIIDQFERLRDGDPYWSGTGTQLSEAEIAALAETTLSDVILANSDIDHLQEDSFFTHTRIGGAEGEDALTGTDEADLLLGFDGADVLAGGQGDDELVGGAGDDVLTGGAGADRFVVGPGTGHDVITDFNAGVDRIAVALTDLPDDLEDLLLSVGDDVMLMLDDHSSVLIAEAEEEDIAAAIDLF